MSNMFPGDAAADVGGSHFENHYVVRGVDCEAKRQSCDFIVPLAQVLRLFCALWLINVPM